MTFFQIFGTNLELKRFSVRKETAKFSVFSSFVFGTNLELKLSFYEQMTQFQ
jgi:hypothetical protein